MGRKKIQKAPKTPKDEGEDHSEHSDDHDEAQQPEPAQEKESPIAKGGKKGRGKQSNAKQTKTEKVQKQAVLFSDEFINKVDTFKNFYRSYLEHRANSEDLNVNSQFEKVSQSVRGKIQKVCSKVLREDISDAQKWIQEKIGELRSQISKVETAQANTRAALEATGSFTASQIQNQLKGVREKKGNFEQCIKDLEQVKERAVQIYKTSGMDQE